MTSKIEEMLTSGKIDEDDDDDDDDEDEELGKSRQMSHDDRQFHGNAIGVWLSIGTKYRETCDLSIAVSKRYPTWFAGYDVVEDGENVVLGGDLVEQRETDLSPEDSHGNSVVMIWMCLGD